jgi:small subunit ribosomal protein S13
MTNMCAAKGAYMLLTKISQSINRGKVNLVARISGVTIPDNKQAQIALTYVYGIGPKSASEILTAAKVDPTVRTKDLTDAEISRIQDAISTNYTVEGDLQRIVTANIKRLQEINSYRGLRHKAHLPSRGQRTRTNARTRRGRKVTVGGTAKKAASKT